MEKILDITIISHFKAIQARDIMALLKTVSEQNITLILPNGKHSKSLDEYRSTNEEWFKDKDWKLNYEILEKKISGNIGIVLSKIFYHDKNQKGEDYSFQYFLTLIFEKIKDDWKLVFDQNTIIT